MTSSQSDAVYRDEEDESQPLMADTERDEQRTSRDKQHASADVRETGSGSSGTSGSEVEVDDTLNPSFSSGQLELQHSSGQSTPRFIQDESTWKTWKWVPYPLRRFAKAVNKWSYGPPDARPYKIKPFFPRTQRYPLDLMDRFLPRFKQRMWALVGFLIAWFLIFVFVKRAESIASYVDGWGQPQDIGCGATYWNAGNGCGLDGSNCRPFSGAGYPFRCTANCKSYHALNPRAVGDQEVIYKPLVVGGPSVANKGNATYRGDSYICAAAIHAGIISNKKGGCGVVELAGTTSGFEASQRQGIASIGFDSYFPLSFNFSDVECSSSDMRWALLGVSAAFTALLAIFVSHPAVFFFPTFIGIFWTVGMALDQPRAISVADLFSNVLGKFLPAMFCAWVMYDKMGIRRTLSGLNAQLEKAILWLGPCWVGAMTNYTLDFIPIQRLTPHDLQQQPGAKAALAIIIMILVVIIASQVWFFQKEGRFRLYIQIYGLFVLAIIIGLVLPGLNLRIHHYIVALLLLPGTSLQTRPSLIYQGILVGLFINGIARWGFDSVLQTPAALQGDAIIGTALPKVHEPTIHLANHTAGAMSNITFKWDPAPSDTYDGVSILVNDVERYLAYFEDVGFDNSFVWARNATLGMPEYFRFAFMDGGSVGDYTKAGTWTASGDWKTMKAGPSKVKRLDGRRIETRLQSHRL